MVAITFCLVPPISFTAIGQATPTGFLSLLPLGTPWLFAIATDLCGSVSPEANLSLLSYSDDWPLTRKFSLFSEVWPLSYVSILGSPVS